MHFSLLMSLYAQEIPTYFHRSMQSIWDEQTCKPSEIILVLDGQLTDALYKVVAQWEVKLGSLLKVIPLEENIGLGNALRIGIEQCSYELVARMDTDDIAYKDRFEKQLKIFSEKNIDVCGAWVDEFEENENRILSQRKVPQKHEDIVLFSKSRNPMNHPTVMYKKCRVEEAGNYQDILWFEDYYLWIRMILNGTKFYNMQEPLVKMRAGYSQLARRSGLTYALSEFRLEKKLYELGFFNFLIFIKNVHIRLFIRIMPQKFIYKVYRYIRK